MKIHLQKIKQYSLNQVTLYLKTSAYISMMVIFSIPQITIVAVLLTNITLLQDIAIWLFNDVEKNQEGMILINESLFLETARFSNILFLSGYVIGILFLFLIIFYSHRNVLNNYSHKIYHIIRPDSFKNDLKFVSTWLLLTLIINLFFSYYLCSIFGINIIFEKSFLYKMVSTYFVQNTIFFILIRTNCFGYKMIKKR